MTSNYINIPKNTKVVIWKNKKDILTKIGLFHVNKKYKIVTKSIIQFDKWSNYLILKKNKFNNLNLKIDNFYYNFLKAWNFYIFCKIKFKGKGFRIKFFKKIKLIKFFFGRSHKTFILLKKIKKIKINKYKFILTSLNLYNLKKAAIKIIKIKQINFYTLRGIRLNKQIIYKRKGKKGTYI